MAESHALDWFVCLESELSLELDRLAFTAPKFARLLTTLGNENTQHTGMPPVEGVGGGGTGYGWSDGILHTSNSFGGVVDPTKVPSAELLHVWSMPSTANIGQQEMPRPLEPISLLVARNERESTQIALRPKVSWGGPGIAGAVQVHCTDLCSTSGDRLVVGQSLTVRHVVPILGVPDALVPLDLPVSQINLLPGETTAIWVSVDITPGQPPGQYEGEIFITALKVDTELPPAQRPSKSEKYQVYQEIKNSLEIMEPVDGKTFEDVVRPEIILWAISDSRYCYPRYSLCIFLSSTVSISETVIEDRFGVEHGSDRWYDALERHFKWLLQYRISPFFCRWGDSMRVLTYTCPWPADHPKADEYYSDPRLAAYAVPYTPVLNCNNGAKDDLRKEVGILKKKAHWKKAYFYLWDEPLNMEQYNSVRSMSNELRAYAPDARVLTTYYCGIRPNDAPLAPSNFEAFVKVPNFLRPHTQIFCTSEWVLGNREDLVKDIIGEIRPENGEEWWTYVCMGPSDPHPNWHLGMRGTQHRAVMWRVWKEGGTGFLYWGANCYEKSTVASAEIRFRRGLPPGDGVLFYPGEVFPPSTQPVASIRLERILSSLQDIEYLKLYASRYGRDAGLALLEKTGVYLGPERYTLEHMPIDVMRAEIFRTCRS
ncbi:hypothetical protein ACLOJK_002851 [Asimina triloba]